MQKVHKGADLFHIGPPKTATTWVYYCLKDHPEICAPSRDEIHYYDMLHGFGSAWYAQHFSHAQEGQKLFDPTYTTISSPRAAKRIYADNPEARFSFVLRNPIERAFSHYWHEKKFGVIKYDFSQTLDVYGLFESWLGMGLLADRLEEWFALFGRDRFYYCRYEDIAAKPETVIANIFAHYGIDPAYKPAHLTKKVNTTGPKQTLLNRGANKLFKKAGMENTSLAIHLTGKTEYHTGVEPELYNRMLEIALPDIERMEKILDIDLSEWKHLKVIGNTA
ncbi:MAG: sulfotransferase [Micavibrio sp.]|nr:sulfotransferase [Micavibrio sp.]